MALQFSTDWMNKEDKSAPFLRERIAKEPKGAIPRAQSELAALESVYDPFAPNRTEQLRVIAVVKTRIHTLELEKDELLHQENIWSPGGGQYEGQLQRINSDRAIAQGMISSPNETERRQGEVRLIGDDREEAKLKTKLAQIRARLRELTGEE